MLILDFINFSLKGSQLIINVTLSGWIFSMYIVFDVISLISTRTFLIHKIYLYFRFKNIIKKRIPYWWEVKSVSFLNIIKHSKNRREIWVEVESKLYDIPKIGTPSLRTYGWVRVSNNLKYIDDSDILNGIEVLDGWCPDELKQYKRDQNLQKIGIEE